MFLLFNVVGYGDKEIYWIAATIAGENFSFEPYLAGSYGDCGEILHFDPLSASSEAAPYFLNCQYIADGLGKVGKNFQSLISLPVLATKETKLFNMGEKDKKSAGRCGSCIAMGCSPVPPGVNEAILKYQQFIIDHTRETLFSTMSKKISNFLENVLDS
jgi:Mannosyltransferase putative